MGHELVKIGEVYAYRDFVITRTHLIGHDAEWLIVNETGYRCGLFWEKDIGPSRDEAQKYCTDSVDTAFIRRSNALPPESMEM